MAKILQVTAIETWLGPPDYPCGSSRNCDWVRHYVLQLNFYTGTAIPEISFQSWKLDTEILQACLNCFRPQHQYKKMLTLTSE